MTKLVDADVERAKLLLADSDFLYAAVSGHSGNTDEWWIMSARGADDWRLGAKRYRDEIVEGPFVEWDEALAYLRQRYNYGGEGCGK